MIKDLINMTFLSHKQEQEYLENFKKAYIELYWNEDNTTDDIQEIINKMIREWIKWDENEIKDIFMNKMKEIMPKRFPKWKIETELNSLWLNYWPKVI